LMEPASNDAISGLSASGASRSSTLRLRPGMPLVVRQRMASVSARRRSTTSLKTATSWVPRPVAASRTCTCTTLAPAFHASMPERAISSGVMGMCGVCCLLIREPVSPTVMMSGVSAAMSAPSLVRPLL